MYILYLHIGKQGDMIWGKGVLTNGVLRSNVGKYHLVNQSVLFSDAYCSKINSIYVTFLYNACYVKCADVGIFKH